MGSPEPSSASQERFEALISWLRGDEAMSLPLAEVEKRLGTEVPTLLRQMLGDHRESLM